MIALLDCDVERVTSRASDVRRREADRESRPGFARKEILFTRKHDTRYCICPLFPDQDLVVKAVVGSSATEVTLLGHGEPLTWHQTGDDLTIAPPTLNPSKLPCQHAFVFKISKVAK